MGLDQWYSVGPSHAQKVSPRHDSRPCGSAGVGDLGVFRLLSLSRIPEPRSTYAMPQTFVYQRRIEFRETDMAGIVHFSNFFAYMEQAEHAFLRSIGLGVICELDGQKISFPRVNASCDYRNAIKFEEIIDIEVRIKRIGTKSITYGFQFSREGTPVAEGSVTTVCCRFDHETKPQSIPIPPAFVQAIRPFLEASSDE